jgi:hypothetical protein
MAISSCRAASSPSHARKTMRHLSIRCFIAALAFALLGVQPNSLRAQTSTLQDVQAVFNTSCTFSSCHDASTPAAGLNLSGTAIDIYNALVNQDPINPQAAGKGYKLVSPGLPDKSFLMHKLARASWDDYYGLGAGEGDPMPTSGPLADEDIELVRQWIQFGAPLTGEVVDPDILSDYYSGGLGKAKLPKPEAPFEGEGVQIRLGTVFLSPGQEFEYFYKMPVRFDDSTEVTRTQVFFNDESHHFILYRYPNQSSADSYRWGLREIYEPGGAPDNDVQVVAAWQDPYDIQLPEGSAYFWGDRETLDMNFHIFNDDIDSVLAADVYVNLYTRPRDPSQPTVEMFSQILPIDLIDALAGTGWIGQSLVIPGDGAEHSFEDEIWFPLGEAPTWHLWYLSSHTHERGVDYDVYLRNSGEQIFEGFYNVDYSFNQGFYDWEHPPVRIFDELLPIYMGIGGGIRHEATYINNTGSTITWGDRTTDEMMLLLVQYTEEPLPSISNVEEPGAPGEGLALTLSPNPAHHQTSLRWTQRNTGKVQISIYDAMGRLVATPAMGDPFGPGPQHILVDVQDWPAGMYTVLLESEEGRSMGQLLCMP